MSSAGRGAIFAETGGEHINPVDMFKMAEVLQIKAEIAKMNKDMKLSEEMVSFLIKAQKSLEQ